MKFGVVVFPGSNCDHDAFYAIGKFLQQPVEFIWHQSEDLANCDAIILPGGFSHGDYLRTGAIARFSPVMKPVEKFAKSGGTGSRHLQRLPDFARSRTSSRRDDAQRSVSAIICRHVHIRVENTATPFTHAAEPGQILKIPIAHNEGNYTATPDTLAELQKNDQSFSLHHARRKR